MCTLIAYRAIAKRMATSLKEPIPSSDLYEHLFDGVEQERPLHESLSEREFEVLRLIVSGTPLASIADSLHVSPKTISTHKMRIMQKLGIDNNAALFRYAANHGLTME